MLSNLVFIQWLKKDYHENPTKAGVRKNITHRKQTEKQKLKMATMAPK